MRKQATRSGRLSVVPTVEGVIEALVPRPLPTISWGAEVVRKSARSAERFQKRDLVAALVAAYRRICALESKVAGQEGSAAEKIL